MPNSTNDDKTKDFLRTSSEIAGDLAGTALQLLFGAPGGIAGAIIIPVARDFALRVLSQREQDRVVSVLDIAVAHLQEKLRRGYEPRADGFLTGVPGRRWFADEVIEGVLIAAQREHEERKIKHLAYLISNFFFESQVDRRQANYLVRLTSELSWTQLCLLSIFHRSDIEGLRSTDYADDTSRAAVGWDTLAVLSQVEELWLRNLVSLALDERKVSSTTLPPRPTFPGSWNVVPSKMKPLYFGENLALLAELGRIDRVELDEVADLLR